LDVKVATHVIAVPPSDQSDNIGINVGTKQGHGTGGSKGMGRDISGKETKGGAQECESTILPLEVRRGSGFPRPANVCPTLCKASSTVPVRTGLLVGAMVPMRYHWAKTWKRETGASWRLESRASTANSSQKSDQSCQWLSAVRWAVTPDRMASCASSKSRRKWN
jgi:hypothetical protein